MTLTDFQEDPLEDLATLENDLRLQLTGRVGRFRLLVGEHGVVLRGYALSSYDKQLAEQVVNETAHLPIEANEIRVYQAPKPGRLPMRMLKGMGD